MAKVMVVDDEQGMRDTLRMFLEREGHDVYTAPDAEQALDLLKEQAFDVIVADIILPRKSGVDLLQSVRDLRPEVKVILITGEPTVDTAAWATRAGAFDYLVKPVSREDIWKVVAHAAMVKALEEELQQYRVKLEHLVEERTLQAQMYRDIVECSVVGIFLMRRGLLTYINKEFGRLLGFSSKEPEGTSFFDLLEDGEQERIQQAVGQVERGAEPFRGRIRMRKSGETVLDALVVLALFLGGKDPIVLGNLIGLGAGFEPE